MTAIQAAPGDGSQSEIVLSGSISSLKQQKKFNNALGQIFLHAHDYNVVNCVESFQKRSERLKAEKLHQGAAEEKAADLIKKINIT